MSLLEIVALLIGLSALGGALNHRFLKLPHTIALVIFALAASGAVILIDVSLPQLQIGRLVKTALRSIDFERALMEGMLSALLFAAALQTNTQHLISRRWVILVLATFGVIISTLVVASAMWLLAGLLGFQISFAWACVFGALISPTDPVAVIGIFKELRVPPSLHAKIAGESLLNDGVGIIAFNVSLAVAAGLVTDTALTPSNIIVLFLIQAVDAAVIGLCCGYIASRLIALIDDHSIEVMITIALVAGTYALALRLETSGPIAVVIAGLLIARHTVSVPASMKDRKRPHIFEFWELTDDMLNSVLFLLIGLEVLVINIKPQFAWFALAAVPVVLFARWISVLVPIGLLSLVEKFERGTIAILTWGGIRGGVSVALALSLPQNQPETAAILAATYAVVVFSIIVQGATLRFGLRRLLTPRAVSAAAPLNLPEVRAPAARLVKPRD